MIPNSLGNEFRSNAIDVSEPLRLRVRSKEYETEWIPMELVDRPKIEDFSIKEWETSQFSRLRWASMQKI